VKYILRKIECEVDVVSYLQRQIMKLRVKKSLYVYICLIKLFVG